MATIYRIIASYSLPRKQVEELRALSKKYRVPQSRMLEEALGRFLKEYEAARAREEQAGARPMFEPLFPETIGGEDAPRTPESVDDGDTNPLRAHP